MDIKLNQNIENYIKPCDRGGGGGGDQSNYLKRVRTNIKRKGLKNHLS